jgi:hypothetical protein
MERIYNAPILTATISVTDVDTTVALGNTSEYESFLFDNQGSYQVTITLGTNVITLEAGNFIELKQDDITSLKIKAEAGHTSSVYYVCQGYKRLGQ